MNITDNFKVIYKISLKPIEMTNLHLQQMQSIVHPGLSPGLWNFR